MLKNWFWKVEGFWWWMGRLTNRRTFVIVESLLQMKKGPLKMILKCQNTFGGKKISLIFSWKWPSNPNKPKMAYSRDLPKMSRQQCTMRNHVATGGQNEKFLLFKSMSDFSLAASGIFKNWTAITKIAIFQKNKIGVLQMLDFQKEIIQYFIFIKNLWYEKIIYDITFAVCCWLTLLCRKHWYQRHWMFYLF